MRLATNPLRWLVSSLFLALGSAALEDLPIYTDNSLAPGWENWSWNSVLDFAATDLFDGISSIKITSDPWAAVSFKFSGSAKDYAGLKFDIAGAQPDIQIYFQSVADDSTTSSILLSTISKDVSAGKFTTLVVDFNALPGTGGQLPSGTWDRINIQALGNGASYHLDNLVLLSEIVIAPEFLSAEPIASDVVAVTTKGEANASDIAVSFNGKTVPIASRTTYVPVDAPAKSITYLTLASPFKPGNLTITAGSSSFSHVLPVAQTGSISPTSQIIDPLIYGVNFPSSASYIKNLGVTISRWGGNAVTAYNPFDGFTNAGNDWFFENRVSENGQAEDWLAWVHGAGSSSMLTIPALDWVSKDATSYSYPRTLYPDQQRFNPYNSDSGNGLFPNGSYASPPPDPNRVYKPWNSTLAQKWLKELKNKPAIVTVDNEIEIAHNTHQDMHPEPVGYDEELSRVIDTATAAKEALPNVLVGAPSTCSWWFYWTSAIGWSDTEAHGGIDFIPWFLQEMRKHDQSKKKRFLDYLDIHYYFQADTSKNDDAAKALRLRATRSLWDPTYVDESWVGTDPQNHQPSPGTVQLIPRMKNLIKQHYPGTKLSIGEWSSTNDNDITGGLVTVDSLGFFGRYGLDAATYWVFPGEMTPVGLAFWLYRGYGRYFGSNVASVALKTPLPDTQSVFAATEKGKFSVVLVNKNPDKVISFSLSRLPAGKYFIRHFGGKAGVAKWQTTITLKTSSYIAVPAYTAIFLQQQ